MTEKQVSYFFAKLSDACHSRFSSHRYRHTVATELMKKPEQNLYLTQKLLGTGILKSRSAISNIMSRCSEVAWREIDKAEGEWKDPELRLYKHKNQKHGLLWLPLISGLNE